jgi:hypothetical protein
MKKSFLLSPLTIALLLVLAAAAFNKSSDGGERERERRVGLKKFV